MRHAGIEYEWTKKNHFHQGYGQHYINIKSTENNDWRYEYRLKAGIFHDALAESVRAAREISDYARTIGKVPTVCLSGGIDSEFVAEIFKMSGVPFKLVTMRFPNDQNRHELNYALAVAERFDKEIEFYEIDPLNYYESKEFTDWVARYTCPFPMLILQMKIMEFVALSGGFPILGSGECYVEKTPENGWCFFEREIFSSLFRFVRDQNLPAVPAFFQWSPELILSFLMDPQYRKLYEKPSPLNQAENFSSTLEVKHQLYNQYVSLEARTKYYGWETFANDEKALRVKLLKQHYEKYGNYLLEIKTPIDDFIRMLK